MTGPSTGPRPVNEDAPITDVELIDLLRSRSERGIRGLVDRDGPRVKYLLMKAFGRHRENLIEEAISDATYSVWEQAEILDPAIGVFPFFFRCSKNALIGILRGEALGPKIGQIDPRALSYLAAPEPGRSARVQEMLDALDRGISALSEMQQDLIYTWLSGVDVSDQTLSERWNTDQNTIRVSRNKARKRLKRRMKKEVLQ